MACATPNSHLTPLFTPKLLLPRKASPRIVTRVLINNDQQQVSNYWTSLSSEINTHILKSLPATPPPSVTVPMHHLLSAAPPSVAPALCLATCQLVGGQKHHAMNTACAIQLMHAAAHAHTQLILKQENSKVKPGIAMMTGDGILPLGYEMVARSECGGNHKRIVRVVADMARAMGTQGMVEGQLMEAEEGWEKEWRWERKGGRLSACGAACGAIMGGGREEDVEKLRRFGFYAGMINEMTRSEDDNIIGSYEEAIQLFSSLARLELRGFQHERVGDLLELLLGFGCNTGKENRGVINSSSRTAANNCKLV